MTTGVAQKKRLKDDNYVTPTWAIDAIMPVVKRLCPRKRLTGRSVDILDPGAGTGAIGRALREAYGSEASIIAVEKRGNVGVRSRAPYNIYRQGDFLEWGGMKWGRAGVEFDLTMMNPPYRYAQEFIDKALGLSRIVVAILRLDFLASQGRADWFRENPPNVYVLPKRPSFTKDGYTDWYSYGWYIWTGSRMGGTIEWLKVKL